MHPRMHIIDPGRKSAGRDLESSIGRNRLSSETASSCGISRANKESCLFVALSGRSGVMGQQGNGAY